MTGEAYIYASGNPVTWSDPTGLETFGDMTDPRWINALEAAARFEAKGNTATTEAIKQAIVDHHDKPGAMDIFISVSGGVSDVAGDVAIACGLFAWTVVGAKCAGVAGTVSVAAGGVEAGLLAVSGDDSAPCAVSAIVVDIVIPDVPVPVGGGLSGEAVGGIVVNTVTSAMSTTVGSTC